MKRTILLANTPTLLYYMEDDAFMTEEFVLNAEFRNREELTKAIHDVYRRNGVMLTTRRSKPFKVWLKCDKGGEYRYSFECDIKDPVNALLSFEMIQ